MLKWPSNKEGYYIKSYLHLYSTIHSIIFLTWSFNFGIGSGDLSVLIFCFLHWALSQKQLIFLPWKKACPYGYKIFFSVRVWRTQMPSLLIYLIFSRLWIGTCWGEVVILKYFFRDCIPPIFLKHLNWCLISILVWVHHSMMYLSPEQIFEKQF